MFVSICGPGWTGEDWTGEDWTGQLHCDPERIWTVEKNMEGWKIQMHKNSVFSLSISLALRVDNGLSISCFNNVNERLESNCTMQATLLYVRKPTSFLLFSVAGLYQPAEETVLDSNRKHISDTSCFLWGVCQVGQRLAEPLAPLNHQCELPGLNETKKNTHSLKNRLRKKLKKSKTSVCRLC